jgi:hypothetical protein
MVVIWSPSSRGPCGPAARGERRSWWVAGRRSLAELNYVHSIVNDVHLSRSAFNKGDGAAAAGPHPRRPVTPAPPTTATGRRSPWLYSPPPSTTRTAAAPKLTLPTGGGRGAGRLYRPSGSEFSSAACVDSVTELGLRRSMGCIGSCLDNAVAESFFAALKASSSTASITAPTPAPKREPGSSAAVGEPYRSSAGALGSPVVAER